MLRLTAVMRHCSVKEMDPGQIGLLIKLLNMVVGFSLMIWAGVLMTIRVGSYVMCGEDDLGACCPSAMPGATKCATGAGDYMGMSLWDNFSCLIIAVYMVPMGAILVMYEVSTRRVGAPEVRSICGARRPRPASAAAYLPFAASGMLTVPFVSCSRSPSLPASGRRWPRFGRA